MTALSPQPGEVAVDCTLGYGGHAEAFIARIAPDGCLIAMDVDGRQLEQTRRRLGDQPVAVRFHHSNFAGATKALQKENLSGCDILFADIGVSSMQIDNPDRIYPYLLKGLLPKGMMGLVFAAFLAAMMSTVSAILNSAATIWTKDIWQAYIAKNASDKQLLTLGLVLTFLFVIFGMAFAPVVKKFQSIYQAIQNFLTFIQGPSLALLLLGMFWERTTGWGGLAGLVGGLLLSVFMFLGQRFTLGTEIQLFTQEDPFLFIAWWSFVGSCVITVVVSLLTPRHTDAQLAGLTYDLSLDAPAVQATIARRAEL